MLLAEATTDGTWIAVSFAAVSGLFGVLNLLINKKYDAKFAAMDRELQDVKADLSECEVKHHETLAQLTQTKEELKARDARDKDDLQRQINDLKQQLGEGK